MAVSISRRSLKANRTEKPGFLRFLFPTFGRPGFSFESPYLLAKTAEQFCQGQNTRLKVSSCYSLNLKLL